MTDEDPQTCSNSKWLLRKPTAALDLAGILDNPRRNRTAWCPFAKCRRQQCAQRIVFSFSYESQSITLKLRSAGTGVGSLIEETRSKMGIESGCIPAESRSLGGGQQPRRDLGMLSDVRLLKMP